LNTTIHGIDLEIGEDDARADRLSKSVSSVQDCINYEARTLVVKDLAAKAWAILRRPVTPIVLRHAKTSAETWLPDFLKFTKG
jgi:hypothetical protein